MSRKTPGVLLPALLLALALILTGCGSTTEETPSASGEIFAMDTYLSVTCCGEQCEKALEASLEELQSLDALLSVGIEDSEVSRINRMGGGTLSSETCTMVEASLDLWDATGGAFDITVYPIMDLWGFTTGNYAVPDQDALDALLANSGSDKLTLDRDTATLTLGEGQGIDLGGIAKGYAGDRLAELFQEYDLDCGVASLGGDVMCYGTKPDGSDWKIGIRDPLDPDNSTSYLGILSGHDLAVVTSGTYERYFVDEDTGLAYHHILDPATGYPSDSDLLSVTVVCANGMLADGLSTACFVLGVEGSADFWRQGTYDFGLILMTGEGQVYVTEDIASSFTCQYPVELITR